MDGFQRRRKQKQADILEAALQLFLIYGVQKVSINEIAKKANVSQVTIYNYFESKHNLVRETFVYYVDKGWGEMEEILDSNIPYMEKIKQLIFNKKETVNEIHPEFYQYFMKDFSSGESYVEQLYLQKALPRFIKLVDEGKEKGYIDPAISNESIILYMQLLNEGMQREQLYNQLVPYTEEITKLLFFGIIGENKK